MFCHSEKEKVFEFYTQCFMMCVCNTGLQDVYYDQIIRWCYSNLCQRILQPQSLLIIVMYLLLVLPYLTSGTRVLGVSYTKPQPSTPSISPTPVPPYTTPIHSWVIRSTVHHPAPTGIPSLAPLLPIRRFPTPLPLFMLAPPQCLFKNFPQRLFGRSLPPTIT